VDKIENVFWSPCTVPPFLSGFIKPEFFSTEFRKLIIGYMKIHPKVAKFFHADGRKDGVVGDGKYLCIFGNCIKPAEY
jgi:hypothetical protein